MDQQSHMSKKFIVWLFITLNSGVLWGSTAFIFPRWPQVFFVLYGLVFSNSALICIVYATLLLASIME